MDAIILTGASAEEIAALVVAIQERQGEAISISPEDFLRKVVRSTTDDMQKGTAL